MTATKFTPDMRGALLERFAAGCSLPDAASACDLNPTTLKGWLARGRKEKATEYAEFAQAVDEAREGYKNRPVPMDEDELVRVVSESARKGNTTAMKLRWEMLNSRKQEEAEKPSNPMEALDELAERRAARA